MNSLKKSADATRASAATASRFWKNSRTIRHYSCRIINPDGSEAGFSGNGTRCAVAYLYYKNLFAGENLQLKTISGIKNYQLLEREENMFRFLAELGKPKFDLPESPFLKAILSEFGKNKERPRFLRYCCRRKKCLSIFSLLMSVIR
jgi:diaminopimelate epimerase